jgi:hypothetical protein
MPAHSTKAAGLSKEVAVSVFPNPANDVLTITNPAGISVNKYSMKNMLGQVMKEGSITTGKNKLTIDGLAPGSYIITLYKDGGEYGNHLFVKK